MRVSVVAFDEYNAPVTHEGELLNLNEGQFVALEIAIQQSSPTTYVKYYIPIGRVVRVSERL